jgi:hypothetical protein
MKTYAGYEIAQIVVVSLGENVHSMGLGILDGGDVLAGGLQVQ